MIYEENIYYLYISSFFSSSILFNRGFSNFFFEIKKIREKREV